MTDLITHARGLLKRLAWVSCIVLAAGCFQPSSSLMNDQNDVATQFSQVIVAIGNDIALLKPEFSELSEFDESQNVFGWKDSSSAWRQVKFFIHYAHEVEYVEGETKRESFRRPKPGGCILDVGIFPDGEGWPGLRMGENIRNIDLLCSGVRCHAVIHTLNSQLADRIESIIKKRFQFMNQECLH